MDKKEKGMILGRPKSYEISAVNVVLHPHTPELYIELFKDILASQQVVKVRGLTALMLGSCTSFSSADNSLNGLKGKVFKFLKLDTKEPWFDTNQQKPADPKDKESIKIPEHLKPHLEEYEYIFIPKEHKLLFVSKINGKGLSPAFLTDFLKKVTQLPAFSKYKSIEFTVIPEIDVLQQFFNLKRIKTISFKINRPNPDDLESVEEAVLKKLQEQNIRQYTTTIKEATNDGINPSEITKQLMEVASHNGEVEAKGNNASGQLIELSTKKHPLKEKEFWSEGFGTLSENLISAAPKILKQIMRRK